MTTLAGYSTAMGKTQLKNTGFSKAQQRAPGIRIPLHGVNSTTVGYQYRPDHPRVDARNRPVKYENPTGASVRLDIPPRCHPQLGNPSVPIWFTEGVKKADSLASIGACAAGLTGVWGFKGKNPMGGTTILADFDYITLKDACTSPSDRLNLVVRSRIAADRSLYTATSANWKTNRLKNISAETNLPIYNNIHLSYICTRTGFAL